MSHRNLKGQQAKDESSSSSASAAVADDFTSYYLQRATREFGEDLDRVRGADDFARGAADALLPVLVRSLQQGTSMFSPADQARVVAHRHDHGGAAAPGKSSGGGGAGVDADGEKGDE